MIISISGDPGSGKSTIAQMLAKKLKMRRYYMGGLRRQIAKQKGITLAEYNRYGETHPKTDVDIDKLQTKLGQTKDNFIIEGRTSWHFIPHSVKIFVKVDLKEAARRIYKDLKKNKKRNEDSDLNSVTAVYQSLKNRIASDRRRYKKIYGIDLFNKKNYDFVIDTTTLTKQQAIKQVIKFLKSK